MIIEIERTGKKQEIKGRRSVGELLNELNINKEEVLVAVDDKLLHEEDLLSDSDFVRILSVISGG